MRKLLRPATILAVVAVMLAGCAGSGGFAPAYDPYGSASMHNSYR